MSSTWSTVACSPASSSWTGSLFAKPVAASTAPCATAAPWPKSGYSTICEVVGRQVGGREEGLEHDPRRPVAARDAQLLALEVGRAVDARRRLGEHDRRELPVDRREVFDRDALADGRDHARSRRRCRGRRSPCPSERDEVVVDLVLERHVEAGLVVVALPARPGRTARTGRSGCSRARRSSLVGVAAARRTGRRAGGRTGGGDGGDGDARAELAPPPALVQAAASEARPRVRARIGRVRDTGPPGLGASGQRTPTRRRSMSDDERGRGRSRRGRSSGAWRTSAGCRRASPGRG